MIARFFIACTVFQLVYCSPQEVTTTFHNIDESFSFSSNTRLIIQFGDQHPKHLLVYSPEGYVYYFLQSEGLFDEVIFEKELVIDPLAFKGVRYDEDTGEEIEEVVFTTPGKYILYFADNTETEPENTFSRERSVTFK